MNPLLASDVNNAEFVGAVPNPDALLYVEFYWHEEMDKWGSEVKSAEAGKRVIVKKEKRPFVRIMRPGDSTTMIETAVREEHKQRWPERWLYWQMQEGLVDQQEVPGWKLEEWVYLDDKPELLRDLKHSRFQTVDQVGGASDAQVQRMGLGGLGLREQARVDLRNRVAKDAMAAVAEKDKEIAAMQERMGRLEAMLTKPDVQPVTESIVAPTAPPKKRGRPKKDQAVIG